LIGIKDELLGIPDNGRGQASPKTDYDSITLVPLHLNVSIKEGWIANQLIKDKLLSVWIINKPLKLLNIDLDKHPDEAT
jgi:hypothetical protein